MAKKKVNEIAKRQWAKILDGQLKKVPEEEKKKIVCEKCYRRFKTKEGLESHKFHKHGDFEGKFRRPKKKSTGFMLTPKRLEHRRKICKLGRRKFTETRKRQLIEEYDFAQNKGEWEKENVNRGQISQWRKKFNL